MYKLCAPVLYDDCVPYDFAAFAAGLDTNDNVDRTSRLDIRHKRPLGPITNNDGTHVPECGRARFLRQLGPLNQQCDALVEQGNRIRRFITDGLAVLPNLRTVSMGGIGSHIFNQAEGYVVQSVCSCTFENTGKILPYALIDLPTIQNYCQTVTYGPLALPDKILKVKSSLKTFTYHPWAGVFIDCVTKQRTPSPPIILGATNRYFCKPVDHFPYPLNKEAKIRLAASLKPIVAMFIRPIFAADPNTGMPIKYKGKGNIDPLKGTKIEIYDYIRTIEKSKVTKSGRVSGGFKQELPPRSLWFLQAKLDQALPKQWRGKVVLKTREEASPCPACELDLEEDFKDDLELNRCRAASMRNVHTH
jgi:hypothetical protein